MASVRLRSWQSGGGTKFAWLCDYVDQDGERQAKQFKLKKDADEYRKRVEREVSERRHVHDRDTKTFSEACAAMIDAEERAGNLTEATLAWMRRQARLHVLPALGTIKLNRLTTVRLDEFMLAKHESGYAAKYLGHMREVIKKTIRHACYKGWMIRNPLADQPLKILPLRWRQLYQPSLAQIKLLWDAMASGPEVGEHRDSYYNARLMLALAVLGMRRKEIRSQRWEHVNFDAGTLEIVRAATKTNAGVRLVYLPNYIRGMVWDHWHRAGQPATGWVLRNRNGGQIQAGKLSDAMWRKIMQRAGLIKPNGSVLFNLHMMRHFFVAYQRTAGIPDRDVMLVVGHANERVMQEVYDYPLLRSDASARAIDQMELDLGVDRVRNTNGVPALIEQPQLPLEPLAVPTVRPGRYGPVNVRYAEDARAKVLELHEAGAATLIEIAHEAGVSSPTVRTYLKQAGADLSRYKHKATPEAWAAAMDDYHHNSDLHVVELCEKHRISPLTFYARLRELGMPMRHGPRETPEDPVELYKQGVKLEDIAARTGLGISTIGARVDAVMKRTRNRVGQRVPESEIAEMVAMYERGDMIKDIAKHFGISTPAVNHRLKGRIVLRHPGRGRRSVAQTVLLDMARDQAKPPAKAGAGNTRATEPKTPREIPTSRTCRSLPHAKLHLVLGMLKAPGGCTVADICEATGWQAHTTRAWLSKGGAGGKSANIVSEKVEGSDGKTYRVYKLAAAADATRVQQDARKPAETLAL
jgi:integrase/transposase-like protein